MSDFLEALNVAPIERWESPRYILKTRSRWQYDDFDSILSHGKSSFFNEDEVIEGGTLVSYYKTIPIGNFVLKVVTGEDDFEELSCPKTSTDAVNCNWFSVFVSSSFDNINILKKVLDKDYPGIGSINLKRMTVVSTSKLYNDIKRVDKMIVMK